MFARLDRAFVKAPFGSLFDRKGNIAITIWVPVRIVVGKLKKGPIFRLVKYARHGGFG
jgi:hypothetical protein